MPAGASSKRERQYEHIKKSAEDRGRVDQAGQGDRRTDGQQGAGQVGRVEERRQGLHA